MSTAVALAHTASTLGMVAVIWFVQLVHYPLFRRVGEAAFHAYEAEHVSRISWIVIPLMVTELGTSAALIVTPAATSLVGWERWLGLGLVAVAWGSTFLLSVPLHERLGASFDPAAIDRLVLTNWVRTLAWTGRGVLVAVSLARAGGG